MENMGRNYNGKIIINACMNSFKSLSVARCQFNSSEMNLSENILKLNKSWG